ncbi:hypothetical protein ACWE42_06155 [Sutcliffiella cohnii]|uniref:Uncharacterized protein n=1 Tax=Sutcliffiella cohnii TaxID=33932 RepID=A0A223KPV2_9BACI|nr:hypothetical protein [Sutcliffiella cohnii]AST91531.1 hypothetical protein BC6307_09675 [Sutcliffiella cohnii]MED4014899.1 hypothetical protein [Sutcliffiella cohnii]
MKKYIVSAMFFIFIIMTTTYVLYKLLPFKLINITFGVSLLFMALSYVSNIYVVKHQNEKKDNERYYIHPFLLASVFIFLFSLFSLPFL